MKSPRTIEIVGGGLAGLSLGLALQREGVGTTVYEAGTYPRHRVCGEFIAGLRERTIRTLGLQPLLAGARRHREVTWHRHGRLIRRQVLASPSLAISRRTLDARFARAYQESGGRLMERIRLDTGPSPEGRVHATGRRRASSNWLGLKLHVRGLALSGDLEFHLGDQAYVGLCGVEDDWVNVCGLFRVREGLRLGRTTALRQYLEACGLGPVAERVSAGEIDPESTCAVAGITFAPASPQPDRIEVGDAFAMIPPYTGNGMAMAFQGAEGALSPLLAWAQGEASWTEATRVTMAALRTRFHRRLLLASRLHPFLFSPAPQSLFDLTARLGVLPLRRLAGAVHA